MISAKGMEKSRHYMMIIVLYSIFVLRIIIIPTNQAFGQSEQESNWQMIDVKITTVHGNGTETYDIFPIKYKVTSGEVKTMWAIENTKTLWISVNSSSPGKLILELPRSFIDSKDENNVDLEYEVLVSGNEDLRAGAKPAPYEELEKTVDRRVLSIDFPVEPYNSEIISIQGTHIMPEFGIASTALCISLAVVSVVSALSINLRRKFAVVKNP